MPDSNPNNDAISNLWNEATVETAWAPPYDPSRIPMVYMAIKVAAEKPLWKFVEDEKPHFTVNTVLPFWNLGRILDKHQELSSTPLLRQVYNVETAMLRMFGACKFFSA